MASSENAPTQFASSSESRGDALRAAGRHEAAVEAYLDGITTLPSARLCLKLARSYEQIGRHAEARRWAHAVIDAGDDYTSWQAAWSLFQRCAPQSAPSSVRSLKVALLGSYTTTQLGQLLQFALSRLGVAVSLYECHYGQFQQDIIDPSSGLYAFGPDLVVLAVHEGDLRLPYHTDEPEREIRREVERWTSLWRQVAERSAARVVQHNFALPCEVALGHLSAKLPGSRYMMAQAVNARLGAAAGNKVALVDCERLSSLIGKQRWSDPRYWHLSKQAVAFEALPLLARHNAAVIAAELGLNRKCLVLDLDNTLWGGVIAEDGLAGIKLGDSVDGEAFVRFQEYILELKQKGIILAVCSKNNHADAIQPFEQHPEMRVKLDDVALFVANWDSKPDNLRKIAKTLQIGLDSLVFVDDNPTEQEAVRRFVPEVDVVPLPTDPSQYRRALSQYLLLETASLTAEDRTRTDQYRARSRVMELESSAGSMEDFYRGLQMRAIVAPFDLSQMPRIAQLIGKTNQFNLTTKRHGMAQLEAFLLDPNCVHGALRLRDRYADHGLVSLVIAHRQGSVLDIDTWLMSCRVIGRTVEATMLEYLCRRATSLGCVALRGTYIPTPKNALAADAYAKFGFEQEAVSDGATTWIYDLSAKKAITNPFIAAVDSWEPAEGAA